MAEESYAITGIRQEDVDHGVHLEEAIEHLQRLAPERDTWLVAWGDADRKVLGNVCEKYGLEYPFIWENYIDLAEDYKEFNSLDKRASLKKAIEENAIQQIGILHSAFDDAVNAAQVMAKMMSEGWTIKKKECNSQGVKKVASIGPKEDSNLVG
ncbi:putative 3'-5' exonuclease KapD [Sporomusaceae bacterium FL31]|nr:putative 3'-5' exonuclease KapD [Sporomusaceae bacterium FL31]